MTLTRRHFLSRAATVTAGFAGLQRGFARDTIAGAINAPAGFGPLVKDPEGILDLPAGFSYSIFSRVGEEMDDGLLVPGLHDAMAAFPGRDGLTLLVRNHEIEPGHQTTGPFGDNAQRLDRIDQSRVYDRGPKGIPSRGGTSTLVYDTKTKKLLQHSMSLVGTERNCAGGPTPRGTWITCEETVARRDGLHYAMEHGWCFEVPATHDIELCEPVALTAMGRFNHEACCTDPDTGIVYQTEDRHDGLIYRFVPADRDHLSEGGWLQALVVLGRKSLDTRNWPDTPHAQIPVGTKLECRWIAMDHVESPEDDLRYRGFDAGAARFARGEGMWWGRGAAYFACTNGGHATAGQIWRLTPAPKGSHIDTLELFIEPNDTSVLENADNITFSPWGDIVVCEDGTPPQRLIGVTPEGAVYRLAENVVNGSEFAGACFSPDGTTMFVNIQRPGFTVAITGPWKR